MTRVDELQKKYPNLAREIIVKWEVVSRGIRDTEVLDKVSVWDRAGSYQNRDIDGSLKEMAEKRPKSAVKPGMVMRPVPFYMKNGINAMVIRASASPYEVKELGGGRFALFEGEENVEEIYFPAPKPRNEEALTSKGNRVSSLISGAGHCFLIFPLRYCEYFTYGEECKFCNYAATYDDARTIGISPSATINVDEVVEAYKIISSNTRLVEGKFQIGALRSSEQEAKIWLNLIERIASAAPYTPNMTISTQPLARKDLQRLKDGGLSCLHFNMEVWDPDMFAEICPGKAKHRGYERYKEAWLEAVDIFGPGRVGSNFVAGVSLMPPNGHKTWQESRDDLIEGIRWLIKNGLFPTFIALRLGPGSIYGDDKANRAKLAPTEYFLDAGLAHHEAMLEYDLYPKYNRLMFCPLDDLWYPYVGEIGIVELGGNVGNWAAECVPDEANWISRFISSVNSPAEPRRKPNDPG